MGGDRGGAARVQEPRGDAGEAQRGDAAGHAIKYYCKLQNEYHILSDVISNGKMAFRLQFAVTLELSSLE